MWSTSFIYKCKQLIITSHINCIYICQLEYSSRQRTVLQNIDYEQLSEHNHRQMSRQCVIPSHRIVNRNVKIRYLLKISCVECIARYNRLFVYLCKILFAFIHIFCDSLSLYNYHIFMRNLITITLLRWKACPVLVRLFQYMPFISGENNNFFQSNTYIC